MQLVKISHRTFHNEIPSIICAGVTITKLNNGYCTGPRNNQCGNYDFNIEDAKVGGRKRYT